MNREPDEALGVYFDEEENIQNLEELQRIRWERDKYREKSRRDLTTGLLNKAAMEEEICSYLSDRPGQSLMP